MRWERDQEGGWSHVLWTWIDPEVWEEAACCIAAVSFEDGSRRSEFRRLLNTQQPADSTQNRFLAPSQNRVLLPWTTINDISLVKLEDVGESHVGGGAEERGDAVVGSSQRVWRTRLTVIPVHVFGHMRQVHMHLIHSQKGHLKIPVDDPVSFKVVIVLSERVNQLLCYLQPAGVEEELQKGEDRDIKVEVVTLVTLGGVEELSTNQTSEEERVDG